MQGMMRNLVVLMAGGIAAIYLINPTFGYIEFIPDNFPLIGNLDEAGATVLLVSALGYYGIDVTNIFPQRRKKKVRRLPQRNTTSNQPPPPDELE